jgi:UDP-N-acetylglucosamine 2-epimerase (non-hydrolysing)
LRMARPVFPYGDGHASKRIVDALYRHFVMPSEMHSAEVIPLQRARNS